MTTAISAIVLAGGESRRMGTDKRSAILGGRSLLEIAIQAVAAITDDLVISCRSNDIPDVAGLAHLTGRSIELAFDRRSGGPLAGVESGLAAIRNELALVITADMPWVGTDDLATLAAAAQSRPEVHGAVFLTGGERAPFPGAYRRTILPIVSQQLDADERRVHDLLKRLDLVELAATHEFSAGDTFFNINTPDDLKQAQERT